jgi:histidinol dehydrogenase
MGELELPRAELRHALDRLPAAQRKALEAAAQRVTSYHERQKSESWDFTEADGTRLGQKVTPLDRVGLYVPGGKAAYPSSVLMNALPAKVAGVGELIMVVPTPRGEKNALVLAAACLSGVDRVFTIGGAQAVAALAYGTQTVPQVDKIVGPGNAYVAAAKRRVFGAVGIDMVAGPSEVLIIADATANPDWVAIDLFAQAEHDELAQSILLCPDAGFIAKVAASIERMLPTMPRREVIAASLKGRGALIQVANLDEACEIANRIAPEHLELSPYPIPARWSKRSVTPGPSSSGTTPPSRWATTAPVPTTSCRLRAARASPRRWASMTSRSAPASSRSRLLARKRWARSRRPWRMAKA